MTPDFHVTSAATVCNNSRTVPSTSCYWLLVVGVPSTAVVWLTVAFASVVRLYAQVQPYAGAHFSGSHSADVHAKTAPLIISVVQSKWMLRLRYTAWL
jgi:hypothetical protein